MNKISLDYTLPLVFRDRDSTESEVWRKNLVFEKGRRYLVQAESGTGKSSLCAYIMGQRSDYEGTIAFDGENIRALKPYQWTSLRQRSLSHLYQELRLFPELTAMENVQIKNKLTAHLTDKRIDSLFASLGLADKRHSLCRHLSFGQQQRVAFIRALSQPFDFLLIDEPISHLDDSNAAIMAEIIDEELRASGAGLVVTSIGRHLNMQYDQTLRM